jgi:hypothetical protein
MLLLTIIYPSFVCYSLSFFLPLFVYFLLFSSFISIFLSLLLSVTLPSSLVFFPYPFYALAIVACSVLGCCGPVLWCGRLRSKRNVIKQKRGVLSFAWRTASINAMTWNHSSRLLDSESIVFIHYY